MARLSALDIAREMAAAGFPLQVKVLGRGTAVALAESSGETKPRDNINPDGSRDRGLWQINTRWHPEVSDACAYDARCSTREANRISGNGSSWSQWTTFGGITYLANLPRARMAAQRVIRERGGRKAGRRDVRGQGAGATEAKPPGVGGRNSGEVRKSTPGDPFVVFPVQGHHTYSDDFGAPRVGHTHQGNDIFAAQGTPVVAPFNGTVIPTSQTGTCGHGCYIVGRHGYVLYCHLQSVPRVIGPVRAGQVVGYVGDTGNAEGGSPHLHFEWHPGGKVPGTVSAINPYTRLRKSEGRRVPVKQGKKGKKGKPKASGTVFAGDPGSTAELTGAVGKGKCAPCISAAIRDQGSTSDPDKDAFLRHVRANCPECYDSPAVQRIINLIDAGEFGETIGPIDVAKITGRFLLAIPAYLQVIAGGVLIVVALWIIFKDVAKVGQIGGTVAGLPAQAVARRRRRRQEEEAAYSEETERQQAQEDEEKMTVRRYRARQRRRKVPGSIIDPESAEYRRRAS